jgi:hypothetical protein
MEVKKYTRYDMIGAINYYSIKNGLHIKYVEKLRKAQLEEIIIQYDINIDEMLFELEKQNNSLDNLIEETKTLITNKMKPFKDKIEMLLSLLNDEQKEKFYEYCDSQQSNI